MDLPKVEGTQVRGRVYHLNLRIKPDIQDLYGGKSHLRGSLRTSDPAVARREVERRRAELREKEQERVRQAEVEDLVAQLTPEQRAAYDAAGGLEGLLEDFEQNHPRTGAPGGPVPTPSAAPATPQAAPAPGTAAAAATVAPGGRLPGTDPSFAEAAGYEDEIENEGYSGDDGSFAGEGGHDGDEETPFTLDDLLEEYAPSLDPEAAQAMRHIVRLFTEFHGDIAFDELTMAHLDEFAEAARGLPADMMAKLADGTYVRDLPFAEMVAWTVHADARPISETTRFQYVALLKELMLSGVPRHRRGDPWSDYRLQILRRETVEPPTKKHSRRFTPSEWTFSDAMLRLLEVAIIVFVALVFLLLWQSRT